MKPFAKAKIALAVGALLSAPSIAVGQVVMPVKYATEIPKTGQVESPAIYIPILGSKKIQDADGDPYYVKLSLQDGLVFADPSELVLKCVYSVKSGASVADPNHIHTAARDLAAANTVTFRLQTGTISSSGMCILSASGGSNAGISFSGLSTNGQAQQVTILSRFDAGPNVGASSSVTKDFVSYTQGIVGKASGGTVTIDVRDPSFSKYFVNAGSYTALKAIGRVSFGAQSNVFGVGGVALTVDDVFADPAATITVSGNILGAAIEASGVTGGVFLSELDTCATELSDFEVLASGQNSISFAADNVTPTILETNVFVCFKANGVTRLTPGQVTVSVAGLPESGFALNTDFANPNLALVDKNGSTVKVLNLPNNMVQDQFFIRVYNVSNNATDVVGTLYAQDGTTLGVGTGQTLITGLEPKAVSIIDGNDVMTAFGITPVPGVATWAGRAWLLLESESEDMRVQALIRSGNGTLTEMGTSVVDDSSL